MAEDAELRYFASACLMRDDPKYGYPKIWNNQKRVCQAAKAVEFLQHKSCPRFLCGFEHKFAKLLRNSECLRICGKTTLVHTKQNVHQNDTVDSANMIENM